MATGYTARRGDIKQILSAAFVGLILISTMFIVGCDNGDSTRATINERISDPGSVFGLFAENGSSGFIFANGLFGPTSASTTPTTLTITDVTVNGTASTGRFSTTPDPSDSEPAGEGDADAESSCNYTYATTNRRVPCPLCDFIVFGENLLCGGNSNAQIFLHLAGEDSPMTRANPLQSNGLDVTVRLDDACNLISVNGVAVISTPNIDFVVEL